MAERHTVEKPLRTRSDSAPASHQVYLEGADILEVETVGGPTEVPAQLRVAGDRLRTVISSIMRGRRGLISPIAKTPV
jgi:hypothetical protein